MESFKNLSYSDLSDLIGIKIVKKSGKPFKSGMKVGTVSGVCPHLFTGLWAFLIEEDGTQVAVGQCKVAG